MCRELIFCAVSRDFSPGCDTLLNIYMRDITAKLSFWHHIARFFLLQGCEISYGESAVSLQDSFFGAVFHNVSQKRGIFLRHFQHRDGMSLKQIFRHHFHQGMIFYKASTERYVSKAIFWHHTYRAVFPKGMMYCALFTRACEF